MRQISLIILPAKLNSINTGNKQATIAYKISASGQPVDIYGKPISDSGRKQAIALMVGQTNPNPTLYEIEMYFAPGDLVNGEPTTTTDIGDCPISIFSINPGDIVLHPGNPDDAVSIYSTYGWHLIGSYAYVTAAPSTAGSGYTDVLLTRTTTLGQGLVQFQDDATGEIKSVYVINTDALGWILETGFWQNLRFWDASGVWNY